MAACPPPADADTLRICVATDTHIGYMGKDPVRKDDALTTFEEVLQICRGSGADLILHGGDLFHDNKPQRGCLYKAMDMLRRYCLGPGDVGFQVVSGPELFQRGLVNYEDPNMNVQLPMFMIHGNHDDPGGDSNLCVANLLEVANLVNYFGRAEDLEKIVVKPILLQKGQTRVAIYGLGNIRDERLHRAFTGHKVSFETPADVEQWFNIMILHQNRHKGNKGGVPNKACINESFLPAFLDLVIWGHEHDCEITPRENLQGEFYVVQPGSSVATSLSQGETKLKHIALIDVKGGAFQCTPTPLWTTRPLMFGEVSLSDSGLLRTDTQAIWDHLTSKIDELILQGEEECRARRRELETRGSGGSASALKVPTLPLVRLRVEHSGFDTLSGQSFGQQFAERVANPEDILLFHKRVGAGGAVGNRLFAMGDVLEIEAGKENLDDGVKIQDIIYKHIDGGQSLQILTEPDLNDAVQAFVHRADPCAIERYVRQAVESANQAVLKDSRAADENEIRVQIQDRTEGLRQQRLATAAAGGAPEAAAPARANSLMGLPTESAAKVEQIEAEDPDPGAASVSFAAEAAQPTAAGRGRGGRGRGRGRGRGVEKRELDGLEAATPPAKVARGRGMPATPAAAHTGRADLLRQVVGSQGRQRHEPAPAGVPMVAAPAPVQAATSAVAAAAPATGFLQKRGGAAAESVWGNPDVADPGSAVRDSQPRASRKWQLRGPDAG